MAAFLTRARNLPAASRDFFVDDNNSIFENGINRVAEAGITFGCNPPANTNFCPTANVTRGQMAAFLIRALGGGVTAAAHRHRPPGGGTFCDTVTTVVKGDCQALLALYQRDRWCSMDDQDRLGGQHKSMQLVRCQLPGQPRERDRLGADSK